MPRFFFNLVCSSRRHPDEQGVVFPDVDQAYMDAHRAASEMAGDILAVGGDAYEYRFEILAEDGALIVELDFSEVLPARVPLAYILIDADGLLLDADQSFCSILGREQRQLLKDNVLALTVQGDRERARLALERLVRTGRPFSIRKRYGRPDGSCVWVQDEAALLGAGVGPRRIAAGCRVLTSTEAGWEAFDKARGLAGPQSREAARAGREQDRLRDQIARTLARTQRMVRR